jgi:chromosome segregation ATPase
MIDRDRSLASGDSSAQRGASSAAPETAASRAITSEQRSLANKRATRDNLIVQRDRAEREAHALTDLGDAATTIRNLGDTAPTAREYRQLLDERTRLFESLNNLDRNDVEYLKYREALLLSLGRTDNKIRVYETLRQARLRLPAMRSDDADQLIMILRHRDAARLRAQNLDQQIRQVQENIDATQKNLSRLKEELTAASGNLRKIQEQQVKLVAELKHQRDALELHIRQKAEAGLALRLLEAEATQRALYINKLAGGAAFLEELAKRGLDIGFSGGEMAPEVELYIPAWAH